jgi:hypothetical protein
MSQRFPVPIDVTINGTGHFQGIRRKGFATVYSDTIVIIDFGAFAFNGMVQMAEQYSLKTGLALLNMPQGGFEIWHQDLERIKFAISGGSQRTNMIAQVTKALAEPLSVDEAKSPIPLESSAVDEDMFNGIPVKKRGRPRKDSV